MNNTTKFWFLEKFSLMNKMGRWNLMKLCERLEMKQIKKGEELHFNMEDKEIIFFLKSGTVKIVSGINNHTKAIIKRGNVFGELALLGNTDGENYDDLGKGDKAIVLKGGTVCFIDAVEMKDMMEKYSSLKNAILKMNGFKIRKLERKLENLLYKDSKTRIKEYLFDYLLEFGIKEGDKLQAENLISHSDIAQLTNTSRQTVSNVMSTLRKEGVIDYDSIKIERIINSNSEKLL